MQKQTAVLVAIITFLFAGLSAGAYFILDSQKSDTNTKAKPAVDVPLESTKSATQTAQSGGSLQVQGDSTASNQDSLLLSPDEFEKYEMYANAEAAQLQETVVGTGAQANVGDTVAVVYKGWLTNGTLFDQSPVDEKNIIKPLAFTIGANQVISGWEQGIFGMKVGGKRRLIIPSKFGYGPNEQGAIPANSMLIFDVELVAVQKPSTP